MTLKVTRLFQLPDYEWEAEFDLARTCLILKISRSDALEMTPAQINVWIEASNSIQEEIEAANKKASRK